MGKSREAHAVAVSALITFGLRALPFLAFSGSRKMPASLERLGQALPSAIMAVLIIYCMKDIPAVSLPQYRNCSQQRSFLSPTNGNTRPSSPSFLEPFRI